MRLRSFAYFAASFFFLLFLFLGLSALINVRSDYITHNQNLTISTILGVIVYLRPGRQILDGMFRRFRRDDFYFDFQFTPHKFITIELRDEEEKEIREAIKVTITSLENCYSMRDRLLKEPPKVNDKEIKEYKDRLNILNRRIKMLRAKAWNMYHLAEFYGYRFFLKKHTYIALKEAFIG